MHAPRFRPPRPRNLEWLEGLVLVAPGLLLLTLFLLWPAFEAVLLSFQQQGLLGRNTRWVGLDNYLEVFSSSSSLQSAWASLRFALIVAPLEMVLALAAALLIARPFPGVAVYRTLFFLTTAVPTSVAAVAWGWFAGSALADRCQLRSADTGGDYRVGGRGFRRDSADGRVAANPRGFVRSSAD